MSGVEGHTGTAWSRNGAHLVADAGTPEGRSVCKLWHDEAYKREDGTSGIVASDRACTPWNDNAEWERKSADLDRVLAILAAHDDLVAALRDLVGMYEAVCTNLGSMVMGKAEIAKDLEPARTALSRVSGSIGGGG